MALVRSSMNDRCKRNRVYAHLQRKCRYSFRYELTLFPLEQFDSSVGSMRRYLYLRSISCQNRRVSWINKLSPFLFTCPKILYIYYEIYKNCKEKYYVCKIVSTFKKFHRKSNCRVVVVFRAEKKGKKRIDLILKILIFKFFQLKIQFIIFLIYSRITIYIIYFSGCPVSGCHLYFCPICRKDELPLLPLSLQKKPEERNHLFRWKG